MECGFFTVDTQTRTNTQTMGTRQCSQWPITTLAFICHCNERAGSGS